MTREQVVAKFFRKEYLKGIIILKLAIAVGLVAAYFLPAQHAWIVGIPVNLLWLYKV